MVAWNVCQTVKRREVPGDRRAQAAHEVQIASKNQVGSVHLIVPSRDFEDRGGRRQ
jgi:hypothetical protein